jgi:glycosyltransferase involved in cell wall biosynthesis
MKVLFLPDRSQGNPYQRELSKELEKLGVNVVFSNGARRIPILRALFSNWKPNILHLHWTHDFWLNEQFLKSILKSTRFLIELIILKILGIKIVWTVHNLFEHDRNYPKIEIILHHFLSKFSNKIIVHCSFAKIAVMRTFKLHKRFEHKILIIPHGNYLTSYKNKITRKTARKLLNYSENEILFLYFGHIRNYKGIPYLVNSFQIMRNEKARLLIVGSPVDKIFEKKLLKIVAADKRIRSILRFIPDNRVQIYMNAADVVVLPYQDILTSGSVLLAMCFGKPVIAPMLGCLAELLDNKGSFLYNLRQTDALKITMEKAINTNLVKMGEHNYYKAKRFGWDKIAENTCKVYESAS